MKLYRGMMTLTLLILLSAMLSIVLLFDDDILRLHSALTSQRQHYVQHSLALQAQSQAAKSSVCSTVPLEMTGTVYLASFQQEDFVDDNQHHIWCERKALFKKSPTKATFAGEFDTYLDKDKIDLFKSQLQPPPDPHPTDKNPHFYWFSDAQTEWQLTGNIYAVIVAEGDLHISGKGKISGTVITKGQLTVDPSVTISYRKATVQWAVQQQSQWHRAEKSWYDFTP